MKRVIWIIIVVCLGCSLSYSQTSGQPVGDPTAGNIGVETAQQNLRDVTVTQFEDAGFWTASMAGDEGNVTWRRLPGAPLSKEELDVTRLTSEESLGIPRGENVLGVRVDFYRRGMNTVYITPMRPLPIEGICKTISLWVVGRNFQHNLKIIISDYFGKVKELTLGKLNFTGWKKLTAAVPPSVVQTDYHYSDQNGIKILGFKIECDLAESRGKYYVYLDDLSAVTDLFLESNIDADDIADIW